MITPRFPEESSHPTPVRESGVNFPLERRKDSSADSWAQLPTAYRLQRIVGRGGFGEVWEAVQESLGRTIAVKRIRPELLEASDEASHSDLDRTFRREALTAAHLDHPNIPPIHDLGYDVDGTPLLAMKLVRGRPWDTIIRDEFVRLPVGEFLARHLQILVSVAQAVAYAHSRGIAHRDLKASQVMVGDYGETMLMDWGLAVVFDPDALAAVTDRQPGILAPGLDTASNPAGTPALMAPEQTRDTAMGIGPWTDVYLLGGILFYLITGAFPHSADTDALTLKYASEGTVISPDVIAPDREKPAELMAIALKALRKRPRERYSSAKDFIAALSDYLSGASRRREAQAITNSITERLSHPRTDYRAYAEMNGLLRSARMLWPENPANDPLRNRLLIECAELALSLKDLSFARVQAEMADPGDERSILLARIGDSEDEQRRTREQLDGAHEELRIQHDRAEELVEFMLGDLQERLRAIGRLDILSTVGEKAMHYYRSLPSDGTSDEVQTRRSQAIRRIGELRFGQGDIDGALRAFEESLAAAEELSSRDPENRTWRRHLAEAHGLVGKVLRARGELDAALVAFSRQMEILMREQLRTPKDRTLDHAIALVYDAMADVYAVRGQIEEAYAHNRLFREIAQSLLEHSPNDMAIWSLCASAKANHGWLLKARGDLDGSLAQYREAKDLAVAVIHRQPDSLRLRVDVAFYQNKIAWVLEARGEFPEALQEFRASVAILVQVLKRDPANAEWRLLLAVTHARAGAVFERMADFSSALNSYTTASDILEQMHIPGAVNVWQANWMAHVCLGQGRILRQLGQEVEARSAWELAVQRSSTIVEDIERSELRHIFTHAQALLLLDRRDDAVPFMKALERRGCADPEFLALWKNGTWVDAIRPVA